MDHRFLLGDEEVVVRVSTEAGGWRVQLPDGNERRIEAHRVNNSEIEIVLAGEGESRTFRVSSARTERGIEAAWNGDVYVFTPAEQRRQRHTQQATGSMAAPMPGVVVDVLVTAGQHVDAYQPLAVVEAMKVMATIEAPFTGIVSAVNVRKGARVAQGEILVEIAPDSEAQADTGRNRRPQR